MKNRFSTYLLCAVWCTLFAQSGALKQGLEFFEKGQYQEALQQFRAVAEAQPGNPAIENVLGITLTKMGRLPEANEHYGKAIQLNPKVPAPHKNLGFNLLTTKEYGPAERELQTALALDTRDDFIHYYLGMVYLGMSKDAMAVDQLERVPALLANDEATSFDLVKAYVRLGRIEPAMATLAKMETQKPLAPAQQYELATLFTGAGLPVPALDRFRRLYEMSPKSWMAKYNLVLALINAKHGDEAVPLAESLCAERPQDAIVLSLLGAAYESDGKSSQALTTYRKAIASDRANPDHYLEYTQLLMDLDRYDEAADAIVQGLKFVKDPYALQVRLGSIHLMSGKYEAAQQEFQNATREHPEIPLAYVALARAYLKQGRDADAVAALAAAHEKLPPDFMLDYFYGLGLSRVQRNEEAVAVLERAVKLDASIPEAHYELGKLYFQMDRLPAARAELERVIQLSPEYASAYYQLSRIYARLGDAGRAHQMAERTKELKENQREEGLEAQRKRLGTFQPVQ